MAISNRDRIDSMLEIVSQSLEPFIEQVIAPLIPANTTWTDLLAAKDNRADHDYASNDVQAQLRMVTERLGDLGFPFGDFISRAQQNLAGELREVRDKWAHRQAFTSDDTYRAVDTAERFVRALGDISAADKLRILRRDVQRATYSEETKRDVKKAAAMPSLEDSEIQPWRNILRPHDDIASGNFARSEFAADLHLVATGQATDDYADPLIFFSRTFLTEGLHKLLELTAQRIGNSSQNAAPVINLQTTFGGGKTHSMLAAWHLVSDLPREDLPQEIQALLSNLQVDFKGKNVRRVAIVGNELSPGQPSIKDDGTIVRTIWGELAYQLGGPEGYAFVAEADATGTNPGTALRDLIQNYAPALILIDEWVAYARGLHGKEDLAGGSFETQFSFAQQLTQAVSSVPGAMLLVSIPASDIRLDDQGVATDLEVGGANGRLALEKLQNVVGRVAHNWSPASSQESFEIVRRRLFKEASDEQERAISATARRFGEFYRAQQGELPPDTRQPDYESRIKAAYPIHPELFDRLYGDWSTLEKFQRTRGVLRLMSAVVHALDAAEDSSPLIMPGSMPLDDAAVRDELTSYLEDSWKSIIETDVDGVNSTPVKIDAERPLFGTRALTRRIARATFMGSAATLGSSHKGIDRQRIFLGVAMPGDSIGNFGSSLQVLSDQATYLYSDAQRYWFDRQPSLNRKVTERAELLHLEEVWNEVVERLRRTTGVAPEFTKNVIAPLSTADLPEADECRLVVLHPQHFHNGKGKESPGWKFVQELSKTRGSAPRQNANTFVTLAPDETKWFDLEASVRTHLAWREIVSSAKELDLTANQTDQAKAKLEDSSKIVDQRLAATWIWAIYPQQSDGAVPLDLATTKIDSSETRLAIRVGTRLGKDDVVYVHLSPMSIHIELEKHLLAKWNTGHISVGELWEYHLRYPYLPRLRDRSVLIDAISRVMSDPGWTQAGFALADSYNGDSGEYMDLRIPFEDTLPQMAETTLLVSPRLAEAQRKREQLVQIANTAEPEGEIPSGGVVVGGPTLPPREVLPPEEVIENASIHATFELKPSGDLAKQLEDISKEILLHMQKENPEVFEIELTVTAEKYKGFNANTVRFVKENSKTLGFDEPRVEDR